MKASKSLYYCIHLNTSWGSSIYETPGREMQFVELGKGWCSDGRAGGDGCGCGGAGSGGGSGGGSGAIVATEFWAGGFSIAAENDELLLRTAERLNELIKSIALDFKISKHSVNLFRFALPHLWSWNWNEVVSSVKCSPRTKQTSKNFPFVPFWIFSASEMYEWLWIVDTLVY